MANDPHELARLLRLANQRDRGEVSEAEYIRALPPISIGDPGADGQLIVPRPLPKAAWLQGEDDEECAAHNREVLAAMFNPKDKPKPQPPPQPMSQSYRDGQPKPKSLTARLKSLAGRKLLR